MLNDQSSINFFTFTSLSELFMKRLVLALVGLKMPDKPPKVAQQMPSHNTKALYSRMCDLPLKKDAISKQGSGKI